MALSKENDIGDVSRHTAAEDSHENPFQADGELSRKADYIISHSRISRTEVQIADPDSPQPFQEVSLKQDETSSKPFHTGDHQVNGATKPGDHPVEAEIKSGAPTTGDSPQKAEQVKINSKKKCCSIL